MENVFNFRDQLVDEYSTFSRSFSKIFACDINDKVEQEYSEGRYWPEYLIQINPTHLSAELDVNYAHLYGLTRDELCYILDPADVMGDDYPSETFRVLKNGELREFGEYRTQRLVLEAWDRLTQTGDLH